MRPASTAAATSGWVARYCCTSNSGPGGTAFVAAVLHEVLLCRQSSRSHGGCHVGILFQVPPFVEEGKIGHDGIRGTEVGERARDWGTRRTSMVPNLSNLRLP